MNEDQLIDAAEREMDLYRNEVERVTAQARLYHDALTTLRDILLRDGDHLTARRRALQVIDSLRLPA